MGSSKFWLDHEGSSAKFRRFLVWKASLTHIGTQMIWEYFISYNFYNFNIGTRHPGELELGNGHYSRAGQKFVVEINLV